MTEDDNDKKEDDKNPDKESSKKKSLLNKKSVQFTTVNDSTDKENNDGVCAAQYIFSFNTNFSFWWFEVTISPWQSVYMWYILQPEIAKEYSY